MKKIFAAFLVILLLSLSTLGYAVKAAVMVTPAELYIKMDNGYITGNTSKKITVINTYPYNVTVRANPKHPYPVEWMRPGRTKIGNLSWITLEPNQVVVPANGTVNIYIYLFVPDALQKGNMEKHWETWIAVSTKSEEQEMFNTGYLIRTYIDTPTQQEGSRYPVMLLAVLLILFSLTVILLLSLLRKRRM